MRPGRVLLLALALLPGCGRPETGAPAPPGPFTPFPIGLCEDWPEESRSLDRVREDMDVLRGAGIRSLRVSIGWDGAEPRDDRFDLAFWDGAVALAAERGIELRPYLAYTPEWAGRGEGPVWTRPAAPAEFAEFAGTLARRYRGRIPSWELWNEPDNLAYWTGTRPELAAMVAAGAAAVRREDPSARVVLGGLAWDLAYLRGLLEEDRLAPSLDVVNLHAYLETWSEEPLEALGPALARAREIVDAHGEGEEIWLAETGYSSYRRGGRVSDLVAARFAYEHTPEAQAGAVWRTLAVARSSGVVARAAWYELRDLPGSGPVIGDVNNRHLGVLDAAGRPKPALAALRRAVVVLGAPLRPAGEEVSVTRALSADAAVHAFARPDGGHLVVAWLPNRVPGRIPRDPEGREPDPRRHAVTLRFPRAVGPVRASDAVGRPAEPGEVAELDDPASLRLVLRGGRTLVVETAPTGARTRR